MHLVADYLLLRYGIICILKNNYCTVVCDGSYSNLKDILNILKNEYSDSELKLIEVDEEEYLKIKDDAVKVNNTYRSYFESDNSLISLEKSDY